jgi:hypothetical protein
VTPATTWSQNAGPRVAVVDDQGRAEQGEAEEKRHHGRPVPASGEQVGDEEPAACREHEDEQRKAEHSEGDRSSDDDRQLQGQPREPGASERRVKVCVEPAEPVEQRTERGDERKDRGQREQAGGDAVSAPPSKPCERGHDEEDQRGPAHEPARAVLGGLNLQQRTGRNQNRDPTEVREEGGARPGSPGGVHGHDDDCRSGRRPRLSRG